MNYISQHPIVWIICIFMLIVFLRKIGFFGFNKLARYSPIVMNRQAADYWPGKGSKREETPALRKEIFKRDKGKCQLCGVKCYYSQKDRKFTDRLFGRATYHLGHLLPNNAGAPEIPAYLEVQCSECNLKVGQSVLWAGRLALIKRRETIAMSEFERLQFWFPECKNIRQFDREKVRRQPTIQAFKKKNKQKIMPVLK